MPFRRTKIVATLGPASNSPEVLEQLIIAGLNVARLNFSHGSPEEHKARARLAERDRAGLACSLLPRLGLFFVTCGGGHCPDARKIAVNCQQ